MHIMTEFSNTLSKLINRYNLNCSKLNTKLGLSYGLVARWKNGGRTPNNILEVKKLAEIMMLSIEEQQELLDSYKKTCNPKYYRQKTAVLDFIGNFQISILPEEYNYISSSSLETPMESDTIFGKVSIISAIQKSLFQECSKTQGMIRMIVDTDNRELMGVIASILASNRNVEVKHIVRMKGKQSDYQDEVSLKSLNNILHLCLCSGNYHPYVEYQGLQPEIAPFFNCLIVTSLHAITFNDDLSSSIISNRKNVIEIFKNMFDDRLARCSEYLQYLDDPFSIMQLYKESVFANRADPHIVMYSLLPCILPHVTEDMVKESIRKDLENGWEELSKAFLKYRTHLNELLKKSHTTMIMSISGLLSFLNTGLIDEIPSYLYTAFSPTQRLRLINRFMCEMENERQKKDGRRIKVLKKDLSTIETGLRIMSGASDLIIEFKNNDNLIYMVTKEAITVEAFYEVLTKMEDECFYDEKEGYKLLHEEIDRWKAKNKYK